MEIKTYTYWIKSSKEISLEQLRQELVKVAENYSDTDEPTIIKLNLVHKGALLVTPKKELVQMLLKNKDYLMTAYL